MDVNTGHLVRDLDIDLKPCPFCGGAPELDTCRYYMSLEGSPGTGVAIYCVNNDPHCSADMMLCREDMPEYSTDDIVAALAQQWNRRPNAIIQGPRSGPAGMDG